MKKLESISQEKFQTCELLSTQQKNILGGTATHVQTSLYTCVENCSDCRDRSYNDNGAMISEQWYYWDTDCC